MFRIGEFSRIGCVTIETLRHYDTLGLLKPVKVDPFTGYRYYTARQLQSLNRIIALKEVGFSLEEIARILRDNPTADELRGMLKAQLVLAESAIETAQMRRELLALSKDYVIGTRSNPFAWWWIYLPSTLVMVLFSLCWNLLGDGLNDRLNPRQS